MLIANSPWRYEKAEDTSDLDIGVLDGDIRKTTWFYSPPVAHLSIRRCFVRHLGHVYHILSDCGHHFFSNPGSFTSGHIPRLCKPPIQYCGQCIVNGHLTIPIHCIGSLYDFAYGLACHLDDVRCEGRDRQQYAILDPGPVPITDEIL